MNVSKLHDQAAEAWVVGSALLSPSIIDDLGHLDVADFFHDDTRQLYAAMLDMRQQGEPIDAALVGKRLGGDNWAARIYEIASAVPVAAHGVKYARIVTDLAKRRRLLEIFERGSEGIANGDNEPDAILERVEADLSTIRAASDRGEPVSIAAAAVEATMAVDEIASRGTGGGLPTGLIEFDEKMGGLFPGELVVLAARPGLGKTSLGLQIAEYNAARQRLVYFVSLEMSAVELSIRLACGDADVSSHLLRSGRLRDGDAVRLAESFNEQSKASMKIHDAAALTVHTIRREVRKATRHGLKLVVIDYLQLVKPVDHKLPREQQVSQIIRSLKETARQHRIPVLVLCQLNRQVDETDVPRLGQLRESGAIEQDADVVLFLSREDPKDRRRVVLSVAKNRNGSTGAIKLDWEGSRTRFSCSSFHEPAVVGNDYSDFGDDPFEEFS